MKNIVISLTTAHHRRTHITSEFGKQGIDFEFFDAVTPTQIAALTDKHNLALDGAFLTDGEKACLLSHVCLWQKVIDDELDHLAVFEDDVYLGQNAHLFFNDGEWLKNDRLDFVKTETFLQERKLRCDGVTLMDNRHAHPLREAHLGTAGYIISRNTAQVLLTYIKSLQAHDMLAIDHIMFEQFLDRGTLPIYQITPALVAQEFILYPAQAHLPSDIEHLRLQRQKQKPKRSLSAKIKGELSNACRKTFGKLTRTKITFR